MLTCRCFSAILGALLWSVNTGLGIVLLILPNQPLHGCDVLQVRRAAYSNGCEAVILCEGNTNTTTRPMYDCSALNINVPDQMCTSLVDAGKALNTCTGSMPGAIACFVLAVVIPMFVYSLMIYANRCARNPVTDTDAEKEASTEGPSIEIAVAQVSSSNLCIGRVSLEHESAASKAIVVIKNPVDGE